MEQQDKSLRILQAAAQVFSEHGFHAATIDQIAEAAGVGKGTVYLYFKSKEGLFHGFVLRGLEHAANSCADIALHYSDPRERLEQLAAWQLQFIAQSLSMMQMVIQQALPQQMNELRPEVEAYLERFRDLYAHSLEEGIAAGYFRPHDTKLVAVAMIGALNQVGLQACDQHHGLSLPAAQQEVLRFFFSGIEKVGR